MPHYYSSVPRTPIRMARNRNTAIYKQRPRLGPIANVLVVALILTGMGLLYLIQITKTSVYGFEINELKASQSELHEQNETLKVQAARLQSLERINASEVAKDFESTDELSYLPN